MNAVPLKQLEQVVANTKVKVRREHLRWLCLLRLDESRPAAMMDGPLLTLIRTDYPDADEGELRRSLDYLELHGLLTVVKLDWCWQAKLTYRGVDFVEYTTPPVPGIGRPSAE